MRRKPVARCHDWLAHLHRHFVFDSSANPDEVGMPLQGTRRLPNKAHRLSSQPLPPKPAGKGVPVPFVVGLVADRVEDGGQVGHCAGQLLNGGSGCGLICGMHGRD
jgi:hypothetical protein